MYKYNKIIKDFLIFPFKLYEIKLINNYTDFLFFLKNHIFYINKKQIKDFEKEIPDEKIRFLLILNLYLISVSEKEIKFFSIEAFCKHCKTKNNLFINFKEIKFDVEKDEYPYVIKKCSCCGYYSIFYLPTLYDFHKLFEIFKNIYIF